MKLLKFINYKILLYRIGFLPLLSVLILPVLLKAQVAIPSVEKNNLQIGSTNDNHKKSVVEDDFRVEKVPIQGGAEIITVFVKTRRTVEQTTVSEEVPLVSVLRDTLGDDLVENDRLRNVWILTYTRPTFAQKFAAAVPFLYSRTTNKGKIGNDPPPDVIDLNPSQNDLWNKVFWNVFRNFILGDFGATARSATVQYKNNFDNYRKSAIARALAVLILYETIEGKKILSDTEMKDLQARMRLSDEMLGSLVQNENLERSYQTGIERSEFSRGRNWELLRQYSEAQGLYFEPLLMPDGSATHALVWTTEEDIQNNKNREFDGRFLNIKNPWKDNRLLNHQGYYETRWFDEENRRVPTGTPNAKPRKMIPLALYGLDYPKIPILLIDFRDTNNPKKREVSRRVLNDLTGNVLAVSRFASLPYFVGRYMYGFFTARRGIDVNQKSRVESYSRLKLLLSLNDSLDPMLRDELSVRVEDVSINPLENDLNVETRIAQQQYENLMAFAKRPDGLPKRLENERREEMVRLKHGSKKRVIYNLGHLLSFGLYTHREKSTPELLTALDMRRQLEYHERYLLETARDSVDPKIDGDPAALQQSLYFVSKNGKAASGKTAEAVSKIFLMTDDDQIRLLCLQSLGKIDNSTARNKLLAISEDQKIDSRWRNLSAEYLRPESKDSPIKTRGEEKTALQSEGN